MNQIAVVSAIIEDHDGMILLTKRNASQSYPLCWELPGGKVEAGELRKDALRRELREELGIVAQVGRLVHKQIIPSPDGSKTYEMSFYRVSRYISDTKAGGEDGIQLLAGQLEKQWFRATHLDRLQNMPSMTPDLIAAIKNLYCPCCGYPIHALVQPVVEGDMILSCSQCYEAECRRYLAASEATEDR